MLSNHTKLTSRILFIFLTTSAIFSFITLVFLIQTGSQQLNFGAIWITPADNFNFNVNSYLFSQNIWNLLIYFYLIVLIINISSVFLEYKLITIRKKLLKKQ